MQVFYYAIVMCHSIISTLGRLYRDYMKLRIMDRSDVTEMSDDEDHPVNAIIDSIEKRWSKVDQDLFISAFYLNPFINRKLRNGTKLTLSVIMLRSPSVALVLH